MYQLHMYTCEDSDCGSGGTQSMSIEEARAAGVLKKQATEVKAPAADSAEAVPALAAQKKTKAVSLGSATPAGRAMRKIFGG